jgi:Flp pilus assembly secretin CpaC
MIYRKKTFENSDHSLVVVVAVVVVWPANNQTNTDSYTF